MPKAGETIYWTINEHRLAITSPAKVYWPQSGMTKLDLLEYYRDIGPFMLPFLKDRPATFHVYPRGISDFSFYKRDFEGDVDFVQTYTYHEISQEKIIQVPLINNLESLIYFANKGCIEVHSWASKTPQLLRPDMAIFDLDVSARVPFDWALMAAYELHLLLEEKGLKSYAKTSGGSGMHVYVPLQPKYSFEFVRKWVKKVGGELAAKEPDRVASAPTHRKTHIGNKVVIDYLQNAPTRNTASPYTVRAYPHGPVSTPLSWDEVKKGGIKPSDFTLKNMPARVAQIGDLFADIMTHQQVIPD
ncbi:MAG TPA: hypothetical protein ENK85_07890 [Saprospiraceae bacterium]|nr:hypothetical protein [Saprospiraceae bacterium]